MFKSPKYILFIFSFIITIPLIAQEKKEKKEKKNNPFYIDIRADEDVWLLDITDQYYSFGANFTFGWEGLNNKFTNAFLPKLNGSHQLFKLGISHQMYTPEDLKKAEVDSTDIPYCGKSFLSLTHNSMQPSKGIIFTTRLDLGVVGEIALAQTFQNWYHGLIDDQQVQGWDNQIGNGILLNYNATLMKNFVSTLPWLEVYLGASGTLGSMNIDLTGFAHIRIGMFNDLMIQMDRPYSKKANLDAYYNINGDPYARARYPSAMWSDDPALREESAKSWLARHYKPLQAYLRVKLGTTLNLYDGEMQGSLISFEDSPYTIPYSQVPKLQHTVAFAFVVAYEFGSAEYQWERVTYQPTDAFPPYFPKWGSFNLKLWL